MIGEVLKQVLEEKGVTVSQLSEHTGISNQTLYSIIKRNNMKVDLADLLKICHSLGVSVERFYGDYVDNHPITNAVYLTPHEKEVITAYRGQPEMQTAVDKLLGVSLSEE